MKIDKLLIKELQQYQKRDKVFQWLKKHKKYIFLFLILSAFALISYVGYSLYINNKANKSSEILLEINNSIFENDTEQAMSLLNKLIETGTEGYAFIGYTKKVDLLLEQGNVEQAAEVLNEASNSLSLPKYYTDMLSSLEIVLKINNNENQDLQAISKEIKSSLKEDDYFYFHNLEMYAATLFMLKNYDESLKSYTLIMESDLAPAEIKERAQRAKSTIISLK